MNAEKTAAHAKMIEDARKERLTWLINNRGATARACFSRALGLDPVDAPPEDAALAARIADDFRRGWESAALLGATDADKDLFTFCFSETYYA